MRGAMAIAPHGALLSPPRASSTEATTVKHIPWKTLLIVVAVVYASNRIAFVKNLIG